MSTISTLRAETRTITIAAPPEAVHRFVADPRNLPRWAPGFAPAVRRTDDGRWLVSRPEGEVEILLPASREQGTVDIRAAADPRRAVRSRVVANGEGSEYLFTLFFADEIDEAGVAEQMAVVERELRAVRDLCESAG